MRTRIGRTVGMGMPILAGSLLWGACGPGEPEGGPEAMPAHGLPAPDATGRRVLTARWDTLWVYRTSLDDTLAVGIMELLSDGERVFALSSHEPWLIAFDARSGEPLWSAGTRGEGPHELREPRDFQMVGDSLLAVLDVRNRKIVFHDLGGAFVAQLPLRDVARPQTACPLGRGEWMIKTWDEQHPLQSVGPDGRVLARAALPWTDSLAMHSLMQAGEIVPRSRAGECALAMAFGRGWMRVDRDGVSAGPVTFVEDFDFPGVKLTYRVPGAPPDQGRVDDTYAVADMAVLRDTLVIAFAGRTEQAWEWLDFYDLETMSYAYSLRFPPKFGTFTLHDGTFFIRVRENHLPVLMALRPRLDPVRP